VKILHVSHADVYWKHIKNFRGHFIDLPDAMIVSVNEMNEIAQQDFESEDSVMPLPHMLDGTPIGGPISQFLSHLGIRPYHKTYEAMLILKKAHPAFSPSIF
jgi:hypothetical protein